MPQALKLAVRIATWILLLTAVSYGQSLGDVARQNRKDKEAKASQTQPKVITNEEIPESKEATAQPSNNLTNDDSEEDSGPTPAENASNNAAAAEGVKQRILQQKAAIASLENQIDKLNDSIHFAGGNCVSGCVQWNERQIQKQEEVKRMQNQLEQQKKQLEEMQESARKAGFGSSVYEP